MSEARPVTAGDCAAILPVLARFHNPRLGDDDWRRMLFDLPWPTDDPVRGWALWDGGRAVGFLGAIPSAREVHGRARRFVNLSSWIVDEAYRAESLKLVFPIVADRARTIVNLSPSKEAWEVFHRLGFRPLESGQVLVSLLGRVGDWLPAGGVHVTPDPRPESLPAAAARLWSDMRGTRAHAVWLDDGARACLAIATASPWKGGRTLAHVQYASDWALLWRHVGRVARGFRTVLGTWGVRVDARFAPASLPPFAVRKALPRTNLYRPEDDAIAPADVDGLYTEAVGQVLVPPAKRDG